jgi:hypothetical protein
MTLRTAASFAVFFIAAAGLTGYVAQGVTAGLQLLDPPGKVAQ